MKQFNFAKIKEFRLAANLSQDALAARMTTPDNKVFPQQVSAWENHATGLSVSTLMKICFALGRDPDDFFTDNVEKEVEW